MTGMVTVETGARLHFGFQNLSLAHERLYGGVGVAVDEPRVVIEADPADEVSCDDDAVEPYLQDVVEALGVAGTSVSVHERFERHVGLGSGTQLALACLRAVGAAYGQDVALRATAPALGRGGRSGVGVGTFEQGGFLVDAGHPTERFTTAPPAAGTWTVPQPIAAWSVPASWRFLLVTPDTPAGRSEESEDESMRSVVDRADPGIADEIATLLTRRLLPAVAEGDLHGFGNAVARLGRLNGAWYADEQGGVYRPPAGELIETLDQSDAIAGAGQSSWGPTVYGVTNAARSERAAAAAREALEEAGVDGVVRTVAPRDHGARLLD